MFSETARQSAASSRRVKSLESRIGEVIGTQGMEDFLLRIEREGVRGLRFQITSVDTDRLTADLRGNDGSTREGISLLRLEVAPVSDAWKMAQANAQARREEKGEGKGSFPSSALAEKIRAALAGDASALQPPAEEETALPASAKKFLNKKGQTALEEHLSEG
ncbi:MAG: hypothetical protein ACREOP_05805 [Thermodesulfobacteriota bacterium]